MPQIKLGFDKNPVPENKTLTELKNYPTGENLVDRSSNPLYTEISVPLKERAKTKNATSVYINNESTGPLKVEEQFPDVSQVSSSLLGVPRAETQLSLFSDVSSYGLNDDEFEFFGLSSTGGPPVNWWRRFNNTYGEHYGAKLDEETEEQALAIKAYPVAYTFPYGPEFADSYLQYDPVLFERYINFIRLGNEYYDLFKTDFPIFAETNFLNNAIARAPQGSTRVIYDSNYTEEEIFAKIENWTMAWMNIRDNRLIDPRTNELLEFLPGYNSTNTLPGYSSLATYYGVLQTKKAYRYQPGRISGFTFGFRCSSDPSSLQNRIEWGVGNKSDQYLFQVRGPRFSIIRRSVVPLPNSVIESMGIDPAEQKFQKSGEPFDDTNYFELEIPQDFFNGDSLDGNGPTGYNIDITKVTMYKIEFGWYGAIGARFLAYIPFDNGECRWVVLHNLVIENQMGQPCLRDPFFKFKYTLLIRDTQFVREPQFLYKYGASCYIDGGDDGYGIINTYNSNENLLSTVTPKSMIGILPKTQIENSKGVGTNNKKDIYIEDLKFIADALTKIDIVEVAGCPAFGHHYAPSLKSLQSGTSLSTLSVSSDRRKLIVTDGQNFNNIQDNAKLIGPGLFGLYVQKSDTLESDEVFISRMSFRQKNQKSTNETFPEKLLINGVVENFLDIDLSQTRFSEYNAIAACATPLTGDIIKINFLNPRLKESTGQVAEYFVGITTKRPEKVFDPTERLVFFAKDSNTAETFNLDDILYLEHTHAETELDLSAVAYTESYSPPTPTKMEIDYRLDQPAGQDSGECSQVTVIVDPDLSFAVSFTRTIPVEGFGAGRYLVFSAIPEQLLGNVKLRDAEIGIETGGVVSGSGIKILSEQVIVYQDPSTGLDAYAIEIDTDPVQPNITIYLKPVRLKDPNIQTIVGFFSYAFKPIYVVIGLRDNAQVNNITIQEITNRDSRAFTPEWLTNDLCQVIFSGGSQAGQPCTDFVDVNRTASALIDTQLQQPLRPGKEVTTIYVDPTNNNAIDLKKVYGADRRTITPGELNTRATFIVATNQDSGVVNNSNISINTREI